MGCAMQVRRISGSFTDSQFAAKEFAKWQDGARASKHARLFRLIADLAAGRDVALQWIRGGSHPLNCAADREARAAALPFMPEKLAECDSPLGIVGCQSAAVSLVAPRIELRFSIIGPVIGPIID
jgi:hypothetical protein